MSERSRDWFWQAERDLGHARPCLETADQEWACFAAQQAAEKTLKAVYDRRHLEGRGHILIALIEGLADQGLAVTEALRDACRKLDRLYIPTRYPNGFDAGAPGQFFARSDAEEAIALARRVLEFCRQALG